MIACSWSHFATKGPFSKRAPKATNVHNCRRLCTQIVQRVALSPHLRTLLRHGLKVGTKKWVLTHFHPLWRSKIPLYPEGPVRQPRDNFCPCLAAQLPSPRGHFRDNLRDSSYPETAYFQGSNQSEGQFKGQFQRG